LENLLIELGAQQTRSAYVGRAASASPATGVLSRHKAEQEQLVAEALAVKP
jgi:2-oxoglutarate dehydrogenase E1 component